jgi:hypothetical protein
MTLPVEAPLGMPVWIEITHATSKQDDALDGAVVVLQCGEVPRQHLIKSI